MCVKPAARALVSRGSCTDLLHGRVVARGDRVRADAAVRRGQVHGEPRGRDYALAVVPRRRVPVPERCGRRRLGVAVGRSGSLLVAFAHEVLSVVGLAGEGGRLARVLIAVRRRTGGAGRREHLRCVHRRVREKRARGGGPGRRRGRRRRFADRHLRTHAPVTRVLPRQLSAPQSRRVHAAPRVETPPPLHVH